MTAKFFPYDWAHSDDVQVNFGWRRFTVSDGALKRDPREVVRVTIPSAARTGELIDVARLDAHAITLAVLVLVEDDTEPRRMERSRIRPRFAASLPAELRPLTSGCQSGTYSFAGPG